MTVTHLFPDALTTRQVFGEPIKHGGRIVVPVARISGGGGGNDGGAGFGGAARPVGALVLDDHGVHWRPTVDPTRIAAVAGVVLTVGLLTFAVRRRRRKSREDKKR